MTRRDQSDAIDPMEVCLAAYGDGILASDLGDLCALAEVAGIYVGLIPSRPPGSLTCISTVIGRGQSPGRPSPGDLCQRELQRWLGHRTLAELRSSGGQVGSQRATIPGDARPHAATEAAGERHAGLRPATCGDGWNLYDAPMFVKRG